MGLVHEQRRRHYSGLDADKATIPASGKEVGDHYFASDTNILYFWDSAAWTIIPLDVIVAGMIKTDAVETAKIKNLNVTVGKLAGGITATKLAADCVETLKIKNLNVTKGKAELGFGRYVQRITNVWDKQIGDFVTDGTVKVDGIDLSGIVPAGAVAVVLGLTIRDDAANSLVFVYTSAAGLKSGIRGITQVANLESSYYATLPIDANRLMDYEASNLVFLEINLVVLGWFT